jgi:acetylornithine/N-succinyldiaminopimelate aminotransferase
VSDIPTREQAVHMHTANRIPLTLVRGEGTRVWDDQGNSYLDFVAGIAVNTLGHSDPGLVEAISEQAKTLIHVSNIFYSEPQIELAELLTQHSALDKVFFANSGAEANEGAIKIARKWGIEHRDGAYEIIAANDGFHGRTLATVAATGTPRYREPFGPQLPGFVFVPFDDVDAIKSATTPATAAVMLEAIQAEGGVNTPDADYLRSVRDWCDEQGILLILDEVQTGIGRTGTLFAYEQAGIEPDIMTLAKGLGGGVPIGCVLAKDHCDVLVPGDHGSTFGGNPLATAAGVHVMRRLLEGGVLDNARERGDQLEQRLRALEDTHDLATGQRGAWLLKGLELGADIALEVVNRAIPKGLIANPVRPDVVRFIPPLTVTAEEIDAAVDIIGDVLEELASEQN